MLSSGTILSGVMHVTWSRGFCSTVSPVRLGISLEDFILRFVGGFEVLRMVKHMISVLLKMLSLVFPIYSTYAPNPHRYSDRYIPQSRKTVFAGPNTQTIFRTWAHQDTT